MLLDDLNEGGMDVTGLLIATPDHGDPGTGCQCAPGLALGARKNKLNAVVVRCAPPDGQRDVFGPDVNSWHPREAAWG